MTADPGRNLREHQALADYTIAQGRIWILVLFKTLFAPIVEFRLRRG
jgi:hypothetical protein